MAEYLIRGETLTGIADAIRGKTGGTDPVAVSDMAAQIEGIQAGGGDIDALIDKSITEISSNVTSIGVYAFYDCTKLKTAYFPMATSIGGSAFIYSSNLETADFSMVTHIKNTTFAQCYKLKTLVLRSEAVVTLAHTNALADTVIEKYSYGHIYVPSALIEDYKVATNWSTYATKFRAIEDYTVDGTITGELDQNKI